MKVTDLQTFVYADDIMISGNNVKELEKRLDHWEKESKNYGLQMNLEKTIMLKLSRKEEKNTIVKIKGSEIKQIYRFTYLESMVEKNGMIQN
jgi:hypothetical protein